MLERIQKGICFALFVCTLIVFAVNACYSSNKTPPEQQHQWTEQTQNKTDQHAKNILGSASQVDAAPKTDQGDKKKSNADEIVLQWLARIFDFKLTDALLVLFTFILAMKTGGLFRETARLRDAADKQRTDMLRSITASEQAAKAAKNSAEIADKALKITHRPWVNFDGILEIEKPLSFDATEAKIGFRYSLKNGGHAVAKNVTVILGLRIGPMPLPAEATARQSPYYGPEQVKQLSGKGFGRLILPGESTAAIPHTEHFPRAEFRANKNGTITAWLFGVIGYQDEFDEAHATGFVHIYVAEGNKRQFTEASIVPGRLQVAGIGGSAY